MWILFGSKMSTERVPNGARVERTCGGCGEVAMFYERTCSTKLSLYFIELLEYGKRRVMACGACGTLYATDELGQPAESSVGDRALEAAEKAGAQIGAAARGAFGKLSEAARSGLEQLRVAGDDPPRAPPPSADPLAEDDAELESKFRDLEKRYRIDTGSDPKRR